MTMHQQNIQKLALKVFKEYFGVPMGKWMEDSGLTSYSIFPYRKYLADGGSEIYVWVYEVYLSNEPEKKYCRFDIRLDNRTVGRSFRQIKYNYTNRWTTYLNLSDIKISGPAEEKIENIKHPWWQFWK